MRVHIAILFMLSTHAPLHALLCVSHKFTLTWKWIENELSHYPALGELTGRVRNVKPQFIKQSVQFFVCYLVLPYTFSVCLCSFFSHLVRLY